MKLLKFFLVSLCLLFVGNTFAQEPSATLTIVDEEGNSEITVTEGQELFYLVFWLDTEYEGFSPDLTARLYMPEGIKVIADDLETDKPILMERMGDTQMNNQYNVKGSYTTVIANHTGNRKLAPGSGGLVKVACKVTTATASDDPYVIEVKKVKLFDALADDGMGGKGVDFPIPDFTVNVYVKEAASSVDITLKNSKSYNSYCSDKDLDFTTVENAEAYVVTAVSATEATLTKVTAVPAGEGFLILGKDASSISVPIAAEKPEATGTKLVGVTTATEIEEGNFGLATDGSKFVPLLAGTVPANKAYLPASAAPELGAKEFMLVIDGIEVTGISEIQTESKANGAIYNLNGARVSAPQKGVYIMNGRKVIVK